MASGKGLLGDSAAFLEMMESVSRYAKHQRPVLVIGERGTGKEAIAARLHYLSPRWQKELIKVNCAAFSDELLDSELFGHEAGAFTGAQRSREGLFQSADGGTLFLDELATMGPRLQDKLLRVIEYGEFYRVGGSRAIKVDVRVIAATNEDLPGLAEQGKFRHDLLDRLAFDVLALPPLRFRQQDILLLANHFAFAMATELQWYRFAGFSAQAEQTLLDYHWPGNVRELKNAVERSVCRAEMDLAGLDDIEPLVEQIVFDPFDSPWLQQMRETTRAQQSKTPPEQNSLDSNKTAAVEKILADGQLEQLLQQLKAGENLDLKQQMLQVEKTLMQAALKHSQFHQQKAATQLGLSYDQLRARIKKFQL